MKIDATWKTFLWLVPIGMTALMGCNRKETSAPLRGSEETVTSVRSDTNDFSTPDSRFLAAYHEWRRNRIDIEHKPYRNSYYPTYTIGPEYRRIAELGPEAVPLMAKRVEDLLNGDKQYGISNWCDICLIYGINEIMGWKAGEFFGPDVKGFVNMDEYGWKVVNRVKSLKQAEMP